MLNSRQYISTFVEMSKRPREICELKTAETINALGALAQETRLALFKLLVQRGPEGLSAGLIAEKLRVPPSSLSFHLQQLVHARLITQRRASRQLFYAADFTAMNELVAYLTENCCGSAARCTPVCNPVTAFTGKERTNETPARARRR